MDKQTFVMNARASGSNKDIATLEAEWQLIFDNYNPAPGPITVPPEQQNAEAIDTWLKALKQSASEDDQAQFETLRKQSLVDQYNAWVTAGSP